MIIGLFRLFFLLIAMTSSANGDVLRFVMQEFPPFNYTENNIPAGPAVDILNETCKLISIECKITVMPWVRAQKETREGLHHGIFSVGWNEDRDKWLYYSYPLMETEYGFFVLQDSPIKKYEGLSTLQKKSVIVYGPSNTSKRLDKLLERAKKLDIVFSVYRTVRVTVQMRMLLGKRGNMLFSNKDVGYALLNEGQKKQVRYIGKAYDPYHYFIGFSRKMKGNYKNFKAFNVAYGKLLQSGRVAAILDKYNQTLGDHQQGREYTDH